MRHPVTITLAAAAAAVSLAACGSHGTATPAYTHLNSPSYAHVNSLSCRAQYETWKHGPARPVAKTLVAAFRAVQRAGQAQDIPQTVAALKRAGSPLSEVRA